MQGWQMDASIVRTEEWQMDASAIAINQKEPYSDTVLFAGTVED